LAVDWSTAGSAEFFVEADRAFSTATIYSLAVDIGDGIKSLSMSLADSPDLTSKLVVAQRVRFSSAAVPEPSAGLVFAIGMLIAGRRVTR
jgi:hypothetical protein